MAVLRDIVFDCRHPASLARFWAAALDGHAVAPYDDDELARLRAEGIDDPEDDPTVLVEPPAAGMPRLWFQHVPEEKTVKNRVHLDLGLASPVDDGRASADAEIERLCRLGATVVADRGDLVVLSDPEGNEFCVLR